MELWAGQVLVSSVMQRSGRGTAALDISYFKPDPEKPDRSNHFDILTNSGFGFPWQTVSLFSGFNVLEVMCQNGVLHIW